MKLIYIGSCFYQESGTFMSSIYYEGGGRCDWGKVELALSSGENVDVRPASESELAFYNKKLNELKKKLCL